MLGLASVWALSFPHESRHDADMCGRYSHRLTWKQIHDLYRLTAPAQAELDLKPRYNVAPTQDAPVVRLVENGGRELAFLRWGLVPHWAKDAEIGYSTINARAETVETRPAYRDAFRRRRCLVPADGFYEWQAQPGGPKQPYYIGMKDGAPFAMAGLWDRWEKGEEPIESFTIIVTAANKALKPIHDRMPVIVAPDDYGPWLSGEMGKEVLGPYPSEAFSAYPVSRHVNNPANDDARCIEEASA